MALILISTSPNEDNVILTKNLSAVSLKSLQVDFHRNELKPMAACREGNLKTDSLICEV